MERHHLGACTTAGAAVWSLQHLTVWVAMVATVVTAGSVQAAVLEVSPGGSVQAAINASGTGDTVLVHQGTYVERIDFFGKAITVTSEDPTDPAVVAGTVLDGGAGGSVVSFTSGEGAGSVLTGLTICNGSASTGGGISCVNSSPTIRGNAIAGNSSGAYGGGICCWTSSPVIEHNIISSNRSSVAGGGICCLASSSPDITHNTVSGNDATDGGGGIYCGDASPRVEGNTISGNRGRLGGGVACDHSSARVAANAIVANGARASGGGIWCWIASPTIEGNAIVGNGAYYFGGGVYFCQSSGTITGCTLSGNGSGGGGGGGILCSDSALAVSNTIVAFSTGGGGIRMLAGPTPSVSYSDVYSNVGGDYVGMDDQTGAGGNICADPLFAGGTDVHLMSTGGRWDPVSGSWVVDSVHSSCIDTGDPDSDFSLEPEPNGGRINMGAYGGTWQASKAADEDPPVVQLDTPSSATLWPPNGKRVSVHISGSVTDAASGVAQAWLQVNDEYDQLDGTYDVTSALQADGTFSVALDLIASRRDTDRDGRTYEIILHATDVAGNEAQPVSVTVWVPHDMRR
jgi:parallel beta-helix repeat protein